MTRPIVLQKTSAAEAEGQVPKSFGIGQLCSASVILKHLNGAEDSGSIFYQVNIQSSIFCVSI